MKLKLTEWASISEIVGTLAVVVSLLLLVRSVDQNTEVITASEANNIWESWRQIAVLPVLNNAQLAEVHSKVLDSEQLSTAEQRQWDVYLSAQIDLSPNFSSAAIVDLYRLSIGSTGRMVFGPTGR